MIFSRSQAEREGGATFPCSAAATANGLFASMVEFTSRAEIRRLQHLLLSPPQRARCLTTTGNANALDFVAECKAVSRDNKHCLRLA